MKTYNIDNGINIHHIKTDKFKSNVICILFRESLKKENVTLNAMIPLLLMQGSKKYKDNKKINLKVDSMNGAIFNIQTVKKGEEQIMQVYFEYTPIDDTLSLNEVLQFLNEIIYNQNLENNRFNKNIFDIQKEKLLNRIESQINNKNDYSKQKAIEISCAGEKFSINAGGYIEDINKITNEKVSKRYNDLLKGTLIDFVFSDNLSAIEITEEVENVFKFKDKERMYKNIDKSLPSNFENLKRIEDKIGIEQAKLCIIIKLENARDANVIDMMVLSEILGGSSNSLLFKNIREKEGLCYYIYSFMYIAKKMIVIQSGVEKTNLQKAINEIKKTIKNIKNNLDIQSLNLAKNNIVKQHKLMQDNQSSNINFYITQYMNDLPVDYQEIFYKVNNVKLDDIKKLSENLIIDTIYSLE